MSEELRLPEKGEKVIFIGSPVLSLQEMLKDCVYFYSSFPPEQIMAEYYVKSQAIMDRKEVTP